MLLQKIDLELKFLQFLLICCSCSLINQILRLTKNCLSYDFIGTSNDETTDDSSTIQIPTNWRPAFLDLNYLNLFFDLYHLLPPRLSSLALSTLVQVSLTSLNESILRSDCVLNVLTFVFRSLLCADRYLVIRKEQSSLAHWSLISKIFLKTRKDSVILIITMNFVGS